MTNPFTPTFGVTPPLLVGRDAEIATVLDALDDGVGSPGRATLVTGPRGAGKTVTLNAIEDAAAQRGWLVISETARPGVAVDLTEQILPRHLHELGLAVEHRLIGGGASAAGIGANVTRENIDRYPLTPTFRSQLVDLTEALKPPTAGVLITLDEVHRDALGDLQVIAQAVQHAFREGREVAFVAAGLPSAVMDALHDRAMTFLRRAERLELGPVPRAAVRRALEEPIHTAGRQITPEALSTAADGTRGYPFLIQLVGRQIWNADRQAATITEPHAVQGVEGAVRRVGRLVHEPALADLSTIDRSFLAAMAADDGPSQMRDIRDRLGADSNYVSQYRLRLIAAGVIAAVGRGKVDFTLPYLRDYLRDHVAGATFT